MGDFVSIRIVLADDHRIIRDGLAALLAAEHDFAVVGEAEDGLAVIELVAELSPHVVVMDISMPGLNGVDATRRLRALEPPPRVVILSMHSDRRFVLGALKAGASAYLLKDGGFDELAAVIRAVVAGGIRLSPQITDTVIHDYIRLAAIEDSPSDPLSPREREVLQLLAEGDSTKVIAGRLGVSVKTVESHRKQVMDKLDLHSVAELTKYAIRNGLTGLE
jgi:DNA-binding NarL/FixJ family response regulator